MKQTFDLVENDAEVRAYQDATAAERMQHDGDAAGMGRVDGAGAIWMAACGAIAFGAVAFAAVVHWTAGGC